MLRSKKASSSTTWSIRLGSAVPSPHSRRPSGLSPPARRSRQASRSNETPSPQPQSSREARQHSSDGSSFHFRHGCPASHREHVAAVLPPLRGSGPPVSPGVLFGPDIIWRSLRSSPALHYSAAACTQRFHYGRQGSPARAKFRFAPFFGKPTLGVHVSTRRTPPLHPSALSHLKSQQAFPAPGPHGTPLPRKSKTGLQGTTREHKPNSSFLSGRRLGGWPCSSHAYPTTDVFRLKRARLTANEHCAVLLATGTGLHSIPSFFRLCCPQNKGVGLASNGSISSLFGGVRMPTPSSTCVGLARTSFLSRSAHARSSSQPRAPWPVSLLLLPEMSCSFTLRTTPQSARSAYPSLVQSPRLPEAIFN